jgi:FixJ family two-component response regulator
MNKEPEFPIETYFEKIFQQNELMIELLKTIADALKPSHKTKNEEGKKIIEQFESLTQRECQIIEYVTNGLLNKEIAHELSVSLSTIEAHRSHIMKKIEAKNIAHLIQKYMRYKVLMEG